MFARALVLLASLVTASCNLAEKEKVFCYLPHVRERLFTLDCSTFSSSSGIVSNN